MKQKVLVTIPKSLFDRQCTRARDLLEREGFEIVKYMGEAVMTREEMIKSAPGVVGAIVGCDVWTDDVLEAFKDLKIIARFGIGLDAIDLDAAKRRKIIVVNARGMNSPSVAEMTVLMAMTLKRNLRMLDISTREGGWMRYAGSTMAGKTYGLVGFGAIAQNVAKLLSGFGMARILAYDLYPDEAAAQALNVTLAPLDEVLSQSDVVSLHVPGSPETHHLIDKAALARMKPSAILINVARGVVVDEAALVEALKSGTIAGAGLDVYEEEPTGADNPLFALDNVVVSPHQAADTVETFDAVSYFDAEMIVNTVKYNKEPMNWVNRW